MISLPSWFSRPAPKGGKKATTPPTSAELTTLLTQADADVADVEAREAAASEREATERSEEAVSAFEDVQLEANRLRRLRDRLRADLEQAQAREAAELHAKELAEADATRDAVSHAGLIAEATALAEGKADLYKRLAELEAEGGARARDLSQRATRARVTYERHGSDHRIDDHSSLLTSTVLVVDMLDAHARGLDVHDPRREFLNDLIHQLAPNRNAYTPRAVPRREAQA